MALLGGEGHSMQGKPVGKLATKVRQAVHVLLVGTAQPGIVVGGRRR